MHHKLLSWYCQYNFVKLFEAGVKWYLRNKTFKMSIVEILVYEKLDNIMVIDTMSQCIHHEQNKRSQ